jgi:hypothetical protein
MKSQAQIENSMIDVYNMSHNYINEYECYSDFPWWVSYRHFKDKINNIAPIWPYNIGNRSNMS